VRARAAATILSIIVVAVIDYNVDPGRHVIQAAIYTSCYTLCRYTGRVRGSVLHDDDACDDGRDSTMK
jgi:hypothetical protein